MIKLRFRVSSRILILSILHSHQYFEFWSFYTVSHNVYTHPCLRVEKNLESDWSNFFILKNQKILIDWQLHVICRQKLLPIDVGQVCLTLQTILCTFAHMMNASAIQTLFVCIFFWRYVFFPMLFLFFFALQYLN